MMTIHTFKYSIYKSTCGCENQSDFERMASECMVCITFFYSKSKLKIFFVCISHLLIQCTLVPL